MVENFSATQWILSTAAVVTALGVLYKKLYVPTKSFLRDLFTAVETVNEIKGELNDGQFSLKETVTRIDARQIFQDQRQKALIQNSSFGVMEADANGMVIWANRTHLKTANTTMEELSGRGWLNSIHPDDVERICARWESSLRNQMDFHENFMLLLGTGEYIECEVRGYSMRDLGNHLIGYVFIFEYGI